MDDSIWLEINYLEPKDKADSTKKLFEELATQMVATIKPGVQYLLKVENTSHFDIQRGVDVYGVSVLCHPVRVQAVKA